MTDAEYADYMARQKLMHGEWVLPNPEHDPAVFVCLGCHCVWCEAYLELCNELPGGKVEMEALGNYVNLKRNPTYDNSK